MANRNDLVFIDANGEIVNSTAQDTLVYRGMKTEINAVADVSTSDALAFTTGNKTAGLGDSGSIDLSTGTSLGGKRGRINLDASLTTIGDGVNGDLHFRVLPGLSSVAVADNYPTQIMAVSGSNGVGITNGGTVAVIGGDVTSTQASDDFVGGDTALRSGADYFSTSTAGTVNSGSIVIETGNAQKFVGSTQLGANSGTIALTTGTAAGDGQRGSISLDAFKINMLTEVNMNSNKISNVSAGTLPTDAINKSQLDGALEGLSAKQSVRVATVSSLPGSWIADNGAVSPGELAYDTTAKTLTWAAGSEPTVIDGITLADGDRILVKDETLASGPLGGEGRKYHGIYVRTSATVWTRAEDFNDVSPINEIQGAYVPVSSGTANEAKFFVQSGTVAALDTDNINFVFFNAIATGISGGAGITNASGNISVDLLANGGLELIGAGDAAQLKVKYATTFSIGAADDLAVKASDLAQTAGAGRVGILDVGTYYTSDNIEGALQEAGLLGSNNQLGISNNATAINTHASDLLSTANGLGASLIGVEDAAGNFTGNTQEAVNAELFSLASAVAAESYTTAGGYTAVMGDLLYISATDIVTNVDTSAGAGGFQYGFSLAGSPAAPSSLVEGVHDGQVLVGALPAGTFLPGDRVYYDSTQAGSNRFVTVASAPSTPGTRVWIVGTAKNANDLIVDINYIKKNA